MKIWSVYCLSAQSLTRFDFLLRFIRGCNFYFHWNCNFECIFSHRQFSIWLIITSTSHCNTRDSVHVHPHLLSSSSALLFLLHNWVLLFVNTFIIIIIVFRLPFLHVFWLWLYVCVCSTHNIEHKQMNPKLHTHSHHLIFTRKISRFFFFSFKFWGKCFSLSFDSTLVFSSYLLIVQPQNGEEISFLQFRHLSRATQ